MVHGWGTDIDEEALKRFPTSKYISVESELHTKIFSDYELLS